MCELEIVRSTIVITTGKGISSVISSVEGSLGIPSPTSVADENEEEEKIVSKLANGMALSQYTGHCIMVSSSDAVEHDVPSHGCNLEEDNITKRGEKMVREEPHPSSTSSTTAFWNSLGTIASSVQSTVSVRDAAIY